jgi:RHS repeat-associated protein
MGNITSRSDVNAGASWAIDPVHKHQVISTGAGVVYQYDTNGNMTMRAGFPITWNATNLPVQISGPGETITLDYGPYHQAWRQVYTQGSTTETTYAFTVLMQRVDTATGSEYRHYLYAGSERIAIYSRSTSGGSTLRYILTDPQSSVASLLSSSGTTYVNESFAPFGTRRDPLTWSGAPSAADLSLINAATRIGYTGETMLGNLGLVHLKGRVEDAVIGRFLSADPYVPNPGNTQDFNRYSYVENNPVSMIDPTGFDEAPVACFTTGGSPFSIFSGGSLGGTAYGTGGEEGSVVDGSEIVVTASSSTGATQQWFNGGSIVQCVGGRFSPTSSPPKKRPQGNQTQITCDTVLPNGQTVGDVVRAQQAQLQSVFDSTLQTEGGPLPAELGTFLAMSSRNGPFDFKNTLRGQAGPGFLGSAGNFAYYATGSSYIPNGLLDFGAGAYAVKEAVFGKKPFSSLTGPMFSDASAAAVRNAALASNGCHKP